MGRKTLVLLGTLGFFSPVVLQSLSVSVDLIILAVVSIVYVVMFNSKASDRLVKLIAAITSLVKNKNPTKKN